MITRNFKNYNYNYLFAMNIHVGPSIRHDVSETFAMLPCSSTSCSDSDFSTQTSCQCQCCFKAHAPYQLLELADSGLSHVHFSKERSSQVVILRHMQPSWYKSFPWISICSSRFKINCATCCTAIVQSLIRFPKHEIHICRRWLYELEKSTAKVS